MGASEIPFGKPVGISTLFAFAVGVVSRQFYLGEGSEALEKPPALKGNVYRLRAFWFASGFGNVFRDVIDSFII